MIEQSIISGRRRYTLPLRRLTTAGIMAVAAFLLALTISALIALLAERGPDALRTAIVAFRVQPDFVPKDQ